MFLRKPLPFPFPRYFHIPCMFYSQEVEPVLRSSGPLPVHCALVLSTCSHPFLTPPLHFLFIYPGFLGNFHRFLSALPSGSFILLLWQNSHPEPKFPANVPRGHNEGCDPFPSIGKWKGPDRKEDSFLWGSGLRFLHDEKVLQNMARGQCNTST